MCLIDRCIKINAYMLRYNNDSKLFILTFLSLQEIALSVVENDSAQTALQISGVTSQIKILHQMLDDQNEALQKQNNLITTSEAEIVRNSALIERKQTQTDQLNKKILLKISKMEGVSIYAHLLIYTQHEILVRQSCTCTSQRHSVLGPRHLSWV